MYSGLPQCYGALAGPRAALRLRLRLALAPHWPPGTRAQFMTLTVTVTVTVTQAHWQARRRSDGSDSGLPAGMAAHGRPPGVQGPGEARGPQSGIMKSDVFLGH